MCHHVVWGVGVNNSEEHAAKTAIIKPFECQFCAAATALLNLNAQWRRLFSHSDKEVVN
jgi:hypothetical protein